MWLVTPIGFFSVVQKPADVQNDTLTIRARVAADLDALRIAFMPQLSPTQESTYNDYRFRANAPREAVVHAMASLTEGICYDNFKDEVARVQGEDRADLYHEVWSKFYRLQDDNQYNWDPQRALSRSAIPKATSYGGVLLDEQGRVLMLEPAGHFGGYAWTYAKGRPELGETPRQTALREVAEETGYSARIQGRLPGLYTGSTGTTVFFVMEPLGNPIGFQKETAQICWVSLKEAQNLIEQTSLPEGKARDLKVLKDLTNWLARRDLHTA